MAEFSNTSTNPALEIAHPALLTLALIRKHFVPLASRTLFRMIASGEFPKADISIGRKVRLWRRETIEKWIRERSEGERRAA
jgi:predicted DNA-binding transcriptional regulator AlpA